MRNSAHRPPEGRLGRGDDRRRLRQRRLLEVTGIGDRHLGAAHAADRRVELPEGALQIRALISAERLPLRQPSSTITARRVLRTEARIGLVVERPQNAQVDHLRLDALRWPGSPPRRAS